MLNCQKMQWGREICYFQPQSREGCHVRVTYF